MSEPSGGVASTSNTAIRIGSTETTKPDVDKMSKMVNDFIMIMIELFDTLVAGV